MRPQQYVEASLEQFADVYSNSTLPATFDNLFRQFGLGTTSSEYFDMDRYTYVPVIDGVVDISGQTDTIPVTCVVPGQAISVKSTSDNSTGLTIDALEPDVGAQVTSRGTDSTEYGVTIRTTGRSPLVILQQLDGGTDIPACPSTIAHEMTHVAQHVLQPTVVARPTKLAVAVARDILEKELQAYELQDEVWPFAMPLHLEYGMSLTACTVNALRRRYIGNSYRPTPKLVAAFLQNTVTAPIVPKALRSAQTST